MAQANYLVERAPSPVGAVVFGMGLTVFGGLLFMSGLAGVISGRSSSGGEVFLGISLTLSGYVLLLVGVLAYSAKLVGREVAFQMDRRHAAWIPWQAEATGEQVAHFLAPRLSNLATDIGVEVAEQSEGRKKASS